MVEAEGLEAFKHYEAERIIQRRDHKIGRGPSITGYLIKWVDPHQYNAWMPASDMQASELIKDFGAQRAQMDILCNQAKGAAQEEPHPPDPGEVLPPMAEEPQAQRTREAPRAESSLNHTTVPLHLSWHHVPLLHEPSRNSLATQVAVPSHLSPTSSLPFRHQHAKPSPAIRFAPKYPIPIWINRNSPLYRGCELWNNTWEGEQTLRELGLTAEPEQDTNSFPERHHEPAEPAFTRPATKNKRGTPRNRRFIIAPKDKARNYRGQFASQEKEVSITSMV
ncbi:hypothetical protein LA080_010046 [Diaporthe eres]|nr:hypothetical protein LA080_010046 [Diaporthe eres]